MTLSAADVAEIMRLVEESQFDELTLEMDGIKLHLRRAGAPDAGVRSATSLASSPAQPPAGGRPEGAPARAAAVAVPAAVAIPAEARAGDITSPMLGTFYRAPKPGSAPFVDVGSPVEENSVIAIIEVMKLMNTVRAGVKGVIAEILPADGTLVEFGQVLMRTRRDD